MFKFKVGDVVFIKGEFLRDEVLHKNTGTITNISTWINGESLYEIDYSCYATKDDIVSCQPFVEITNRYKEENEEIKQEEEKEMKNEITMPITLGEYEMIMKKREEETKEKLDSEFAKRREEFNRKQEKKVVLNKVTSEDERGIKELLIDIEKLLKEINKSLDK